MFSFFALIALTLSFFTTIGLPAPTSLDAATLLKNGQDAQAQNAAFKTLKVTDTCTTGDVACINGAKAECVDEKWNTTRCARSTQCFALPSVKEEGTTISCTSQRSAQSIINATGAQGDVDSPSEGNNNNTTDSESSTVISRSASSTRTSSSISATTARSTASDDVKAPKTVTVTVSGTVSSAIVLSTDLPAQTLTLPPAEASSFISSLTAGGSFSVVSIIQPSGAAAVVAASSADKPAATTIKLTAAALPVQTSAAVAAANAADSYGY